MPATLAYEHVTSLPGGAWPAGFVAGMPLALPLGVWPPPFTFEMAAGREGGVLL
jgi:hypothetical protein